MQTQATNKKLREILTGIRDKTIIPRPEFQRRLVWTNKDKLEFLRTVLDEYPFPEIYIAAGEVDVETGEGSVMLVDGQQRMTTLYQYFSASKELRLSRGFPLYKELDEATKRQFLDYSVVVRDLGSLPIDDIKRIFERINRTSYSLNAMEIRNARYDGEMKKFAEKFSELEFFDKHKVFSATQIRRMLNVRFALQIVITIMSSYFHRDRLLEEYLSTYNDEFPQKSQTEEQLGSVLNFIESCDFAEDSRVWKLADLFTLVVEIHKLLFKQTFELTPESVATALNGFYSQVDSADISEIDTSSIDEGTISRAAVYAKYALQGTNDRVSRITRGDILSAELRATLDSPQLDYR